MPLAVGQLGKAFRAEAGSPRAPAGCSQARQRQCQHHGIWVFITTQRGRSRGHNFQDHRVPSAAAGEEHLLGPRRSRGIAPGVHQEFEVSARLAH